MSSSTTNSQTLPKHSGTLEVHLLGRVDFAAFLGLQEYLTYELSGQTDLSGKLLICEHPLSISVGREGRSTQILSEHVRDSVEKVPVHWVSRSGGAYPHAPGQLAIYLLIPLERLDLGLVEFHRRFETAVCETCHELKVPAKRLSDSPGIWGRGGQLGFWGASVRSWISNHGLFLNVSISPDVLALTVPNPHQQTATSIQAHRTQPVQMPRLRESLIRTLASQFGYDRTDVSTGHPLLKRTSKPIAIHV